MLFPEETTAIDWVEAAGNYVVLHCGARTHILRQTMNAMELELDKDSFVRIQRSIIVNVRRIRQVKPWIRGDRLIVLRDGAELTLSRTYRDRLAVREYLSAGA